MSNEINFRQCTVPLPIDQIKEYFKDKSLFFLLDYENSKLQDKVFLTYVSNLDIPSDLHLREDYPNDKLFKLLDAYMEIKTISNIEFLNMAMAQILLRARGKSAEEVFETALLTDEQADAFIADRQEVIDRWLHFIDSSMLFLIYVHQTLNDEVKIENYPSVIEDPDYVGLNIVRLFAVPGFLEAFFASSGDQPMSFFKHQFTEAMFKGESLYTFYCVETNPFVPMLSAMILDELPLDPREFFTKEDEDRG